MSKEEEQTKKAPKNEEKKKETKPAKEKEQDKGKTNPRPYAYIEDFILSAIPEYTLTTIQVDGFRAYMQGKHFLKNEKEFIEYLDRYLGKE